MCTVSGLRLRDLIDTQTYGLLGKYTGYSPICSVIHWYSFISLICNTHIAECLLSIEQGKI